MTIQANLPFGENALAAFSSLSDDQKTQFKIDFQAAMSRMIPLMWGATDPFDKVRIYKTIPIEEITQAKLIEGISEVHKQGATCA